MFDVFLPVHTAWWAVSGRTPSRGLSSIYYLPVSLPAKSDQEG